MASEKKKKRKVTLMDRIASKIWGVLFRICGAVIGVFVLLLAPCYVIFSLASCLGAPWGGPTVLPTSMTFGMTYVSLFLGAAIGWTVTLLMSQRTRRRWEFFRSYRQVIIGLLWLLTISIHLAVFVLLSFLYFREETTQNEACAIFQPLYRKINAFFVVFFFLPGVAGSLNWFAFIGVLCRGCLEVRRQSYKYWALELLRPYDNHAGLVTALEKLGEAGLFDGCLTYFRLVADSRLGEERSSIQDALVHIGNCDACASSDPLRDFIKKQERRAWHPQRLEDRCVVALRASLSPNVWDNAAHLRAPQWVHSKILLGCDIENYLELEDKSRWCMSEW